MPTPGLLRPRASAVALIVVTLFPAGPAAAHLRLEASTTPGDVPTVLVVAATAEAPARAVAPEAIYQRRTYLGDPADLAPGTRHEWRLALVPPPGPGSFPVIVHLRQRGAPAGATPAPVVVLVTTPAAPPSPVDATLSIGAVSHVGKARLELANHAPVPVAGRVVVVLPDGFHTEPESQPAEVAAGGSTVVPFAVENRAAPGGAEVTMTVLFEYTHEGVHHTVAARVPLEVVGGGGERALPLAIGGIALGLAMGLLALAWRSAARRT